MSIFIISTSFKSAVFCRYIPWLTCFHGVMAAIIPIPWKVPFLSNVIILWSTLSPTNNRDWPRMSMSPPNTSGAREYVAFISNLCTSGYDEVNLMVERLSIKNRDLYKWCFCTTTPSSRCAITALGGTAWTIACLMPATFLDVSFPTNRCYNKNRKLAGIKSNAAASFSSVVVGLAQLLSYYQFWWVQLYRVGQKSRLFSSYLQEGQVLIANAHHITRDLYRNCSNFLAHSVEVAEGKGKGNLRYGIRSDLTSLATISCERLTLKTRFISLSWKLTMNARFIGLSWKLTEIAF